MPSIVTIISFDLNGEVRSKIFGIVLSKSHPSRPPLVRDCFGSSVN